MSGDHESVERRILEAYYRRRCATSRALAEHRDVPEHAKWLAQLKEHDARGHVIREWLLTSAPTEERNKAARCVLDAWILETMADVGPTYLPKLLAFDIDYLHVLQFSTQLAAAHLRGRQLFDKDQRDDFLKGVGRLFFKKDNRTYPEPRPLLQLFHRYRESFRAGLSAQEADPPLELAELNDYGDKELETLVNRARIGWLALPRDFDIAWRRCNGDVALEPAPDMEYLDRVAGQLTEIALEVEKSNFDRAATILVACRFSKTEDVSVVSAEKKLGEARRLQKGVPVEVFVDHRNWNLMASLRLNRHAGLIAHVTVAGQEGLSASDIASVLGPF